MALTNKEYIKQKMSSMLEHVRMNDVDINDFIDSAFRRVCIDTKVFRFMFPFEIIDGIYNYNLKNIAEQQVSLSYDITALSLATAPSNEDILDFMSSGHLGSEDDLVNVSTDASGNKMMLVDIHGFVTQDNGKLDNADILFAPITKWVYAFRGDYTFYGKMVMFEASVVPNMEYVSIEEIDRIMKPLEEYIRYSSLSNVVSNSETQENNYEYMRYFNEIKLIKDERPDRYTISKGRTWL